MVKFAACVSAPVSCVLMTCGPGLAAPPPDGPGSGVKGAEDDPIATKLEKANPLRHHPEITQHDADDALLYTRAIFWSKDIKRMLPDPAPRMKEPGEWNTMQVASRSDRMRVWINGQMVQDVDLPRINRHPDEHPGLRRKSGKLGFQAHTGVVRFRNLEVRE